LKQIDDLYYGFNIGLFGRTDGQTDNCHTNIALCVLGDANAR